MNQTVAITAKEVARVLRNAELPVLSQAEGNDSEDGMVEVTKRVHVQVPWLAGKPFVVQTTRNNKKFKFGVPRASYSQLLRDVRTAIKKTR